MTPLRGAIVGFGNIAEFGHWPTYSASTEVAIVAVVEPSPARRAAAKALKPDLRFYDSLQALLAAEKPDFVDICTPPASHAALALDALARGAHVLCEKPLSLKAADYEALAAAQEATGKTVFTVHNWKHAPLYQKTFEWLRAGRIGAVWHAEIFVLRNSHCKGAETEGPGTKGTSEDWRKSRATAGGGILVDHGWHAFYLLLNLVQAEPERVLSKMARSDKDGNSLEETAQALVQFPHAEGYIHLTWRAPVRRNSAVIQGLRGALFLDDDRLLLVPRDGPSEEIRFEALSAGSHHPDWFRSLLPSFIEEIRDPARRGQNFREAGWCLALTAASYESDAQGGQEIPVRFPHVQAKTCA